VACMHARKLGCVRNAIEIGPGGGGGGWRRLEKRETFAEVPSVPEQCNF
jgi:hypothetical protein